MSEKPAFVLWCEFANAYWKLRQAEENPHRNLGSLRSLDADMKEARAKLIAWAEQNWRDTGDLHPLPGVDLHHVVDHNEPLVSLDLRTAIGNTD